jgi:hypothetical protein
MLVVTPGIANLIRENKTFRITRRFRPVPSWACNCWTTAVQAVARRKITKKTRSPRRTRPTTWRADRQGQTRACLTTKKTTTRKQAGAGTRPKTRSQQEWFRRERQQLGLQLTTRPKLIRVWPETRAKQPWHMRRIGQILVDLGFITDDQLECCCSKSRNSSAPANCSARSPRKWADHRRAVGPGAGRADGHAGRQPAGHGDPPRCSRWSPSRWPSSTASSRRVRKTTLTVATCDPQNLSSGRAAEFLGYDIRAWWPPSGCRRASTATTVATRASKR